MTRPALASLVALLLHAAAVVWLTRPLAAYLSTRLPNTWIGCRTDGLLLAWALAHQSQALVNAPATFPDGNIFHPTPHALFYGEAGFGAVPYFMGPFLLTGNPALALNLTFLGSVALTAWALHRVVARWTGSEAGGLLAAWTFLTTPWVLWTWIPSAPNYAVLQYLPWIVLLAATPAPSFGAALRLLPLVVLQCLSSIYVAAATVVPLGVLALGRVVRHSTRAAGLRLLAVTGLAAVAVLPAYSGYIVVRAENPLLYLENRAPIWGARRTPLPWGVFRPPYPTGVSAVAFLVIAAGAASLVVQRDRDRLRPAWSQSAFWAVVGLLISLTPVVSWEGHQVTLPQAVLGRWLPIYDVLRAPARMGVTGLIGLALLTGVGFATATRWMEGSHALARVARAALTGLVATTMYLSYARGFWVGDFFHPGPLPAAYPVAPAPDSPLLAVLRRPGGPLLEVPVGAGPVLHAEAMYRSIFHQRPLLNGYSGYWPDGFTERMALACRLPDPDALAALRRKTELATILVHLDRLGAPSFVPPYRCPPRSHTSPDRGRAAWLALAAQGREDLRLVARDASDLLFEVTGP